MPASVRATSRTCDVAVIGAGPSGAAAALFLARAGLSTVQIEARPAGKAGPGCVCGIPLWMFEAAGIERPATPELRQSEMPHAFMPPAGLTPAARASGSLAAIDTRHLVSRLHALARQTGVRLIDRARAGRLSVSDGRPVSLEVETGGPGTTRTIELRAGLFLDATGTGGLLRGQLTDLQSGCPEPSGTDLCDAFQSVHRVRDREAAGAWLAERGCRPGTLVMSTGLAGGFSTACVALSHDLAEAEVLTGVARTVGAPSALELRKSFLSDKRWIGRQVFGGGGTIPIRRPYDRPYCRGAALIGNAACHAFPVHASAIGASWLSAKLLADRLAGGGDPGDIRRLHAWHASFMRSRGAVHGVFDLFRRLSQQLDQGQQARLLSSGLLSAGFLRAGLDQMLPRPTAGDLPLLIRGALRAPDIARRHAAGLAPLPLVYALYRSYPESSDPRGLRLWSRLAALSFGDRPDLG